ncbi:MAG: hypothetical protein M0P02_03485 [Sulfurospirillaceae bacterium]|jgi:hypothetical protein|nr:hypothetical protein [Sulfurospirillaceae bacterium]MCK9546094.1 hypothetical protein [Sulfurospirillaceae bacterium]MDY0238037.1 hypothetical protein [Campylobacterales bacterium]NLM98417.1 hypothetical protein [Campylobacteraceae bacterium]
MESHKVVNIKITYEPAKMDDAQQKELEDKIASFIEAVKGRKGAKVLAKRHDVAVNIMLDEYGIEID